MGEVWGYSSGSYSQLHSTTSVLLPYSFRIPLHSRTSVPLAAWVGMAVGSWGSLKSESSTQDGGPRA